VVAPTTGSIGVRTNEFFASMNALSASPTDDASRADVVAKAGSLAQAFNDASAGLTQTRVDLLSRAQSVAGEVNDKLSRIATLNKAIIEATSLGNPAADLRDQRDVLVGDVSDRIGARSIEDKDGSVTVFAAGMTLVERLQAVTLSVAPDSTGALKIQATRPGGSATDITANVTSGTLGGLREARDADIPAVTSRLDQLANDIATAVNTVHATGVGLDGVSGRPLFAPPTGVPGAAATLAVDAAILGHPERIGASPNVGSLPGGNQVAVQLAQLAGAALGSGTTTPAQRYGSITGDFGITKASADSDLQMRRDTVSTAKTLQESASGVSLDEEMVNMTRFQRAFEASTRVLKTADELLAGLMQML
ncbi:MAG: flagellar hook-associated protein FlgK, partial [Deltaproteobacteria bacterium]